MIDFNDIKTADEIAKFGGDVYAWGRWKSEQNAAFVGRDMDDEKLARLNSLREHSRRIAELEPDLQYEWLQLSNENRHGGVQLKTEAIGYYTKDRHTIELMAEMHRLSDMINVSAVGDSGGIIFSFYVRDMWREHGTIYDEKEKK